MLNFEKAIKVIMRHEGWSGYTNDELDAGGATKYGISLRFLRSTGLLVGDIDGDGDIDSDDIKALTYEKSCELYKKYFFDRYPFNDIEDELLCLHLFDMGVNAGVYASKKLLQRALKVPEDGIIGPITIGAINKNKNVLDLYIEQRNNFYISIAVRNPKNNRFLRGWLNRVKDTKF